MCATELFAIHVRVLNCKTSLKHIYQYNQIQTES